MQDQIEKQAHLIQVKDQTNSDNQEESKDVSSEQPDQPSTAKGFFQWYTIY